MKKQVKLVTTIIMLITLIFSIGNMVLAGSGGTTVSGHLPSKGGAAGRLQTIGEGLNSDGGEGGAAVAGLGKSIVGIMQVVGIVVAVVVILVIGIKYLIGSAEERAEYKKTMIPYLVGAILIFASTTIVNVVYNLATSIKA